MTTFVTAYLAVWLAVGLFVVRLGVRQRRLEESLRALEARFARSGDREEPTSKAA
jgi:CcmD family protein